MCPPLQTCKTLHQVCAQSHAAWRELCRRDWGVTASHLRDVPRMDNCDYLRERYRKEMEAYLDKHGAPGDDAEEQGDDDDGTTWADVYRDRCYGWALVKRVLEWLRAHGHPADVRAHTHPRVVLPLS